MIIMVLTVERAMATRTIEASEFDAKCLELIDEVNETGETLIVTRNSQPLVQVRPVPRKRKSLWGAHAGQGEILEDIVSPVFEDDWEALR